MAEEVQALLVNMDQFYAGPITPTGHCNPSPLMHAGYGIQVNTKGKRFVPETWLQVPKAKAIAERTEDNRSFMPTRTHRFSQIRSNASHDSVLK